MIRTILDRKHLAAELSITVRTVAEWEALGMPVLMGGGKLRRYNLDAVLKWMERRGKQLRAA
jgi:phage terminase Nu1 subunit (DNA packaging protein)